MISVATLHARKRVFRVNDWILDSGAFGQLSKHGRFLISAEQYVEDINRFSKHGSLQAAVAKTEYVNPFLFAGGANPKKSTRR
jgi:hypothetical protein